MVRLVFLLCSLLQIMAAQAASLTLKLDKHDIEMGKFALATITYTGSKDPGDIDLSLWQEHFYLEQGDADIEATDDGQIQTQQTARLYPRHTGKITLDSIALGGSFAKPQYISVKPSVRFGIDGTPKLKPHKKHYWADEVFVIEVDVPRHLAKNVVSAKEWEQKGFVITPLANQNILLEKQAITRLRWQLYSPLKGRHSLELPAIIQRGKGRFRYHLPPLQFRIKPIPLYIPSSVTVGKPSFSSQLKHAPSGKKILELTFNKTGYLPEHIAGFQQIINTLQPEFIEHEQQTDKGISTKHYRLTLPDNLWGKQLTFNLTYFDTELGELQHQEYVLPRLWTITKPIQYLLIFFAITGLFFVLRILNQQARILRKELSLKKDIKSTNQPHELRTLLLNLHHHKTLEQWAKNTHKNEAMHLAEQLNQLCFSKAEVQNSSFIYIKSTLLKWRLSTSG